MCKTHGRWERTQRHNCTRNNQSYFFSRTSSATVLPPFRTYSVRTPLSVFRYCFENITSNFDFARGSFTIPIHLCLDGITYKLFKFMIRWIWKYAIYERGVRLNVVVCYEANTHFLSAHQYASDICKPRHTLTVICSWRQPQTNAFALRVAPIPSRLAMHHDPFSAERKCTIWIFTFMFQLNKPHIIYTYTTWISSFCTEAVQANQIEIRNLQRTHYLIRNWKHAKTQRLMASSLHLNAKDELFYSHIWTAMDSVVAKLSLWNIK